MNPEFCVESKNQPGSFWVDKKSFDKITANAEHHQLENVNVGIKLTTQTKVTKPAQPPPETEPLLQLNMDDVDDSKGITAAVPEIMHTTDSFGKDTCPANEDTKSPLVMPVMNFEEN